MEIEITKEEIEAIIYLHLKNKNPNYKIKISRWKDYNEPSGLIIDSNDKSFEIKKKMRN
jgi:hypothetical protein